MKVVIIDNYDSFTYNLYHLINSLGADATVLRNDKFNVCDLERFDKIMISPGPGVPSDTRILNDVIMTYAGRKPIFGVCLGHQAIGEAFGARLENLRASSTVLQPSGRNPAQTRYSTAAADV